MSLTDMWKKSRDEVAGKRLDQLIAFAGTGRLTDNSDTLRELRELLSIVPSDVLVKWKDEALGQRYTDFGFVLQDIVNEVGRRLGFSVEDGPYRGRAGVPGFDGIWSVTTDHHLCVETKTSSSHRIELHRLGENRLLVANHRGASPDETSVLIVIAEEATEELEAQVRGSRFAWSIRLLGLEALFKLLRLKETLDDEQVEKQIREVLIPQEYTRVDGIIDLIFAAAEDVQDETGEDAIGEQESAEKQAGERANFYKQIIPRLEAKLDCSLVKKHRVIWGTPDDQLLVSCQVSRRYDDPHGDALYWFGLKRTTAERLQKHHRAMCAFGLGSPDSVVLLPFEKVTEHLGGTFTSPDADGDILHWHIRFRTNSDRVSLLTERDRVPVDVTDCRI